jgi:tRNA(Ile)-lysidine synthase
MIKIIKNLIPKSEKYYFAVSMGIDSVAAYYWMKSKDYKVQPIHFNHKMRQQNDLMEEKFIELCKATNEKPIIGRGINLKLENDCRNARISFYESVVDDNSYMITAHHINDWIENYLLNCFRGQPCHDPFKLESDFKKFFIVHPFLLSRKIDFIQFVERNNLKKFVVEDETNLQQKGSRRNWLRNTIIPEMKKNKLSLEKFAERKIKSQIRENF